MRHLVLHLLGKRQQLLHGVKSLNILMAPRQVKSHIKKLVNCLVFFISETSSKQNDVRDFRGFYCTKYASIRVRENPYSVIFTQYFPIILFQFCKDYLTRKFQKFEFFLTLSKDLSTVACFEISDSTATILLEGQILGREYQITNIQSHYKNMDHIAYYRCVAKNSCFDYFSKILWRTSVLCSFWQKSLHPFTVAQA